MNLSTNNALALALALLVPLAHAGTVVTSPDKRISVTIDNAKAGRLQYEVARDGAPVLLPSTLGMRLDGADFSERLSIAAAGRVARITDNYQMAVGKKKDISYAANERSFTILNAKKQKMTVVFRVSNDGVAFRYLVDGARNKVLDEMTTFAFDRSAKAWLQPTAPAQSGWSNVNPSYEEHYLREIAVGTPAPMKAGWVFPALFRSGETWVAITEAGMDGSYQGSRLETESKGGEYKIGAPQAPEVFTGGALLADVKGRLVTPWRVIALGALPTLMESTLGTDLAAPAIKFDAAKVKPGHASWSWALLKDDATVYEVQKKFIDYAADMQWDYTLVDADWDRKIGYEKLAELVAYAKGKNIGVLVWYNSSGDWNKTVYSPKGALLTREQRVKEFARLRDIGVKGVKIDFFAGDGASMIGYYIELLNDAADAGLLVNFHGATLPRGLTRTYPNLMTAEAIRGLEFTTFDQADEDVVARHAAMIPFTRNLFDPMDFTPMVFGDIPKIKRTTRNGFELAEAVLFVSGIQHFAETPEGMATVPDYVKALLRELPARWDEVKFLDGFPGSYVAIARKAGASWYVAGINAEDSDKTITLDLAFTGKANGVLINDGATERAFTRADIAAGKAVITMKPHGGFVAVFK